MALGNATYPGGAGTPAAPGGNAIQGANQTNQAFTSPGNYMDVFGFDNAPESTNLPHIYEKEITIYGNRTLMGFLRMVGSEMPTNSQQIRWAEQKRLHIFYDNATKTATDAQITVPANHALRVNDKILVSGNLGEDLFIVVDPAGPADSILVRAYTAAADTAASTQLVLDAVAEDGTTVNILVVGSEFGKASDTRAQHIQPEYSSYTNSTVIMREKYAVNGTDANQIGWLEIADENGVQGKYWYIKGKSETMTRWEDYLELSLLEDKKSTQQILPGIGADGAAPYAKGGTGTDAIVGSGSEGFFQAIENRGNVFTGGFGAAANEAGGDTAAQFRNNSIDTMIRTLDRQGNIEENALFLNRQESLNFDDGMAAQNNGVGGTSSSWGIFNNSKEMGLSLGFNSVRRGSYDFYKRDWKYLNAVDGRASFDGVRGVGIPMGTKSVYDQYGANLQMPFASIYYLAAEHHNRKNMSWVHGGLAPTPTSGVDALNIEFLTERCICLKGANNFFLFA